MDLWGDLCNNTYRSLWSALDCSCYKSALFKVSELLELYIQENYLYLWG